MTNNLFINIARRRAGESPAQIKTLEVYAALSGILLNLKEMHTPEKRAKKKTSPEVKTRKLKIQPKTVHNAWSTSCFPEIKLRGKWLRDNGFEAGGEVLVTLQNKRLIIEPVVNYKLRIDELRTN